MEAPRTMEALPAVREITMNSTQHEQEWAAKKLLKAIFEMDDAAIAKELSGGDLSLLNKKNSRGWTPIQIYTSKCPIGTKAIPTLVQHGAEPYTTNNSGNNAVTEAVTIGNLELVQYLLGGTCPEGEINRVNTAGITLLMWAASSNKMDIFDFLVQKGANLSAINEDGENALMWAIAAGADLESTLKVIHTYKVSSKALKRKVSAFDLEARDKNGRTALHLAVMKKRADVVAWLLEIGADINAADEEGYTPLLHAVEVNSESIVSELIRHEEVQLDAASKTGHRAWSLAQYLDHFAIATMLKYAGAQPAPVGHSVTYAYEQGLMANALAVGMQEELAQELKGNRPAQQHQHQHQNQQQEQEQDKKQQAGGAGEKSSAEGAPVGDTASAAALGPPTPAVKKPIKRNIILENVRNAGARNRRKSGDQTDLMAAIAAQDEEARRDRLEKARSAQQKDQARMLRSKSVAKNTSSVLDPAPASLAAADLDAVPGKGPLGPVVKPAGPKGKQAAGTQPKSGMLGQSDTATTEPTSLETLVQGQEQPPFLPTTSTVAEKETAASAVSTIKGHSKRQALVDLKRSAQEKAANPTFQPVTNHSRAARGKSTGAKKSAPSAAPGDAPSAGATSDPASEPEPEPAAAVPAPASAVPAGRGRGAGSGGGRADGGGADRGRGGAGRGGRGGAGRGTSTPVAPAAATTVPKTGAATGKKGK